MFVVTTNSESKLLNMLNAISSENQLYYGIHFHFSSLSEAHNSKYQIKIALNIIDNSFKQYEGGIFLCKDRDIIIVYKGEEKALIEKVIFQIRYLFIEDKLAFLPNGEENHHLCSVYILAFQWQGFVNNCKEKISELKILKNSDHSRNTTFISEPLTLSILSEFDNMLSEPGRLEHMIRNQNIWVISKQHGTFEAIYQELYISEVQLANLPGRKIDFTASKLLSRYLSQIVEEKILQVIENKANSYSTLPIGINLNVEFILSKKFIEFCNVISEHKNISLVAELDILDVSSDPLAFAEAKNYLREFGYYICLDGVNEGNLPYLDQKELGFDLIKLKWLQNDASINQLDNLINTGFEPNRIILYNCYCEEAMNYGLDCGISLFQGQYVDRLALYQREKQVERV